MLNRKSKSSDLSRKMESSEETDFLEFQRKVNTLLGMPFYVYFMNKLGERFGAVLATFHQLFTEVIVIMVTIGQFWAVPYIYEDMNVLCGCLSSGSHSAQIIVKTILLRHHRTRYLSQIKAAHSLQKETNKFEHDFFQRESDFANYCRRETKYINIIVTVQLVVNFISTSAYFLPFLYHSIVDHDQVKNQLTPIVVYLPIDFNYTPLFQIIVLTLTVGFYVINLKTVVIDNFILSLIMFHMSELKYHNRLLKELIEGQDDSAGVRKDAIRGWIKQHQALSSVCDDFRKLISPYFFIEFSYILLHTCMPAFVITSTFSWTLPQKVAVFCMVGGGLVELFLMSTAGGVFSEAWTPTGSDVFQPEYCFEDEKWMKHVSIIVQQKIQKPYRLSAFNIIPLNRGTFASILRLIFSYYMTLNQMQNMRREE